MSVQPRQNALARPDRDRLPLRGGRLPLVSVVIPTFDRRGPVRVAIDSVLAQSYAPVECVVVDDASTDGTAEFLDSQYGSRIVLIRNPVNRDKSFSRNAGVRSSTGAYICFLDSDDLLTKDSIERRMDLVLEAPNFEGVVFGLVERPQRVFDEQLARPSKGTPLTLRAYLENPFMLHTNGILARRQTILEYARFNEGLTIREDVEMFIRLLCHFELRSCGTVVARMRAVDRIRAHENYARIIAQGQAFSEALVTDPLVASRIEPFLADIRAREELMLLRALYHGGYGAEFRRRYRQAERAGVLNATWRWRRRYAMSFLGRG